MNELYRYREQTLLKHAILRGYLERFAHIIGNHWPSLVYVDGFSGPWESRAEDHKDTSFAIAIAELRKARQHLLDAVHKPLQVRCYFVESDPVAYARLEQFASEIGDIEVRTRHGRFEDNVHDIVDFVHQTPRSFPFIFIDPTGWTGFGMSKIQPLLRLDPGEVLVNFMTEHIRRFVETGYDGTAASFCDLFGTSEFLQEIRSCPGEARDDALTGAYCRRLKDAGGYKYVARATILQPRADRTHFHLVYGTRHWRGLEVFKKVEEDAVAEMERERVRLGDPSAGLQGDFFIGTEYEKAETEHFHRLRSRYNAESKRAVEALLRAERSCDYEALWDAALLHCLTWESDLQAWLKAWQAQGNVEVEGLRPRERTLKRGSGHRIRWLLG